MTGHQKRQGFCDEPVARGAHFWLENAFEHLGIYIQKHLSQSVAICGKVDHDRPRQSQVQTGTAGYS